MIDLLFSKYSGCGNDFLAIDNRLGFFPADHQGLIQRLCHRQMGVGADGILLLENDAKCDFKMRIFNADGLEASMCGNGLRCLGAFIHELGYPDKPYQIGTMHRSLSVERTCDGIKAAVKATMGPPLLLQKNLKLKIEDQEIACTYLDTGVPHAVVFVEDLEEVPVSSLGKMIRYHPSFHPHGVNATFAKRKRENELEIRTYERGVEGETLACGTGAVASAIAASLHFGSPSPLQVVTRSQESLVIEFDPPHYTRASQTGPAHKIFEGHFNIGNIL